MFCSVHHDLCFGLLLMVLWESTFCTVFCSLWYSFLCTIFFCMGYLTLSCCLAYIILCIEYLGILLNCVLLWMMFHAGYLRNLCFVASEVNSQCCISALVIFYAVWLLCCVLLCAYLCPVFLGFPLCAWNLCHGFQICFQELDKQNQKYSQSLLLSLQDKFWYSVMGVSALRSHAKGKKHQARASRQRCEVLTSDTLLVTKRILMIVVNLFLLLPLQLLKQHLPLLTGAKTYIVWMLKFAGAYAWSTVTAATTVVLI